jgi:chromosomal replication initiation ATPase DnaA
MSGTEWVVVGTGQGARKAFIPNRKSEGELAARYVEILVASAFGVGRDALKGPNRGCAPVAFARQVAIYLAHTSLGLPYAVAGAFFRRDRTTAAYACRTVEDRREDPRIDTVLDCLECAIDLWVGLTRTRQEAS